MPFTFSHPAIVLPFLKEKKQFSATGLVIGSIIPDFESFIFLREWKVYSHTWTGIFWFDLPLAIIFSFIFHGIIRDPLIKNLPDYLGNKFIRSVNFNWGVYFKKHAGKVVLSMLIGIVLHLLWDALTHLNLKNPEARDANIYIHGMNLYIILQYVSSLLGLIAVAWYILALPTLQVKKQKHSKNTFYISTPKPMIAHKAVYWTMFSTIASAIIIAISYLIEGYVGAILYIEISISSILLSLIFTGLFAKMLRTA